MIIKNTSDLAISTARRDALAIAEAGLQAIDTDTVLRATVRVVDGHLRVGEQSFNLAAYRHIYIVGCGKAACTAAYTLEQILGDRVKDGAVVGISPQVCSVVETYTGTHPLPSAVNYTATKHIAEVSRQATADDLVLAVVSGGGSALLCSSMGECEQGRRLFTNFLPSGGTIEEMNIVRKHLSDLKGGGLAATLYPATVVGLIFSDVPGGDMAAVASGPTYFDQSTVADAQAIVDRYQLGDFALRETPKEEKYFQRVHNVVVVSNETALAAMQQKATALGYAASIVSATQYGTPEETRQQLTEHATVGTVQLMGGETKLSIPDNCVGKGGRNDYLALSMLEALQPGQVFLSLASDGRDNTEAAGALADNNTKAAAAEAGLSPAEYQHCLNSFPFFDAVGGHITTGLLQSNVSDLMLLLTEHAAAPDAGISDISATVLKDSRGKPTIAVTVTAGEHRGTFSVPSGASTGEHEVHVVPPARAAAIIQRQVLPALLGVRVTDQRAIDDTLRSLGGDAYLSAIGGNVALGVSVAACKAAAAAKGVETWQHIADLFGQATQAAAPRLFVNLINGGAHATRGSAIQEHQIIPDTDNIEQSLETVAAVQRSLHERLQEVFADADITTGDEGGYVIPSQTIEEPFQYIVDALERTPTDVPVTLGADMAASSFCTEGQYNLEGTAYASQQLVMRYLRLHQQFPQLQHVEDPCDEHDWAGFAAYRAAVPRVLTIGDDLTTTNHQRLERAIADNAINGIIIKPNQIGTLSDTLDTMQLAYAHQVRCIVSHRSGETMDDFIADLAYGTKCYGLKAGAPTMPERAAKYDRLRAIVAGDQRT